MNEQTQLQSSQERTGNPKVSRALPIAWIEKLFTRFAGMYGNKFADLWKNVDMENVKVTWAEDLYGHTGDEIKHGLELCKTRPFPPTLPEFISLCRPPMNPEVAFYDAVKQLVKRKEGKDVWSSKAVYWTAQSIGDFDMNNSTWAQIGKRWTAELNTMISESVLPDIPAHLVALPAPGRTETSQTVGQEKIKKAIAEIKPPKDHKAWAKKIIQMAESKSGIPHPTALRLAQEALNAKN